MKSMRRNERESGLSLECKGVERVRAALRPERVDVVSKGRRLEKKGRGNERRRPTTNQGGKGRQQPAGWWLTVTREEVGLPT